MTARTASQIEHLPNVEVFSIDRVVRERLVYVRCYAAAFTVPWGSITNFFATPLSNCW